MLIFSVWLSLSSCISEVNTLSCGIDSSPASQVYEGTARIETYPWLGILYYPYKGHKFTTAVVLITKQIVLAAANEIDKLPKHNFRSLARVVIGQNCTGTSIGIRDYAYHPDYTNNTFSTLAMIQLEIDHTTIRLRPICPPPAYFKNQSFFAMVLSGNCKKSKVRIHKMKYVSSEQCKTFYRRSDLDVDTLWPSHTACARSMSGGHCLWRSGVILAVKVGTRWRLIGFGVYGPGCQAPARFLDYGMYHKWVRRSVEGIGKPTITTLADNHVVMRRTTSNVQRYGPCDEGEMGLELYTEDTAVKASNVVPATMKHHVNIYSNIEYSCVIFKADYGGKVKFRTPKLKVRRWCSGPGLAGLCHGFGFLEIHFYVVLIFTDPVNLRVTAYGKEAKFIHPSLVYKYVNEYIEPPIILTYDEVKEIVTPLIDDTQNYPLFGKSN